LRAFLAPARVIGFTIPDDNRITFPGFFHRPFRACFPHVFAQPVKYSRLLRQFNTERALLGSIQVFLPIKATKKFSI
jgi:hypothetical protein